MPVAFLAALAALGLAAPVPAPSAAPAPPAATPATAAALSAPSSAPAAAPPAPVSAPAAARPAPNPAGAAKPPPARLHVPKAVRDARAGGSDPASAPLSIFETPAVLLALGPIQPDPGAWVEYSVRTKGEGDLRLKLSILPPALEGGRYWLEVDTASDQAGPLAMKLLVHGNPARPQDLERVLLFVRGQAPLEVPLEDLQDAMNAPQPAPGAPSAQVRRLAPADVRTPAGLFEKAERFGVEDARVWRSPKVPLWGLVRSQSARQTVELIGYARLGAHTLIQGNGSDSAK